MRVHFVLLACVLTACASQELPDELTPVVRVDGANVPTPGAGTSEEGTRLQQAKELRHAAQRQAALLLLEPLHSSEDHAVAAESLALTGVLEAELGRLNEAEASLVKALEGDDTWPGYGKALADLGIVLLRKGDEVHGLATLEDAERRLATAGDADGVANVRENRRRYLEITSKRTR